MHGQAGQQFARVCIDCGADASAVDEFEACPACGGTTRRTRHDGEPGPGRMIANKYALLRWLGRGGFGSVFVGRDTLLERFVAIKVLHVDLEERPEALQRFYAEARNTSKLSHPNNVKVFDFGHTNDGLVYIVMELVHGASLSKTPRPIAPARAVRLLDQVARALGDAHALGIVHRDLKPDNVMLGSVDGRDFVKVLDYGISKLEDSSTGLTADGGFVGTPAFTSPEQVMGKTADRRSDIYCFGLLAYDLLTGKPPFEAEKPIAVAMKQLHEHPPRLRELVPDVSDELEYVVHRCLHKDPERRYPSMADVCARLEATPEFSRAAPSASRSGAVPSDPSSPDPSFPDPTVTFEASGSSAIVRAGDVTEHADTLALETKASSVAEGTILHTPDAPPGHRPPPVRGRNTAETEVGAMIADPVSGGTVDALASTSAPFAVGGPDALGAQGVPAAHVESGPLAMQTPALTPGRVALVVAGFVAVAALAVVVLVRTPEAPAPAAPAAEEVRASPQVSGPAATAASAAATPPSTPSEVPPSPPHEPEPAIADTPGEAASAAVAELASAGVAGGSGEGSGDGSLTALTDDDPSVADTAPAQAATPTSDGPPADETEGAEDDHRRERGSRSSRRARDDSRDELAAALAEESETEEGDAPDEDDEQTRAAIREMLGEAPPEGETGEEVRDEIRELLNQ